MYLYQIFVLNVLWILGFNALFHDDHLLSFVKQFALSREKDTLKTILRPFFLCAECMASIHGAGVYFALWYLHLHTFSLYFIPFYCIALLGTISLMTTFLDYFERN